MNMLITFLGYDPTEDAAKRVTRKSIQAALKAGYAVQFKDRRKGFVKIITKWAPRADGELLADFSTGKSKYVDPYRASYDITPVNKA